MHKARGDEVEFVKGIKEIVFGVPDKIYLTTLFTYTSNVNIKTIRYYKNKFPNAEFWVGGVHASTMPDFYRKEGVNVHVGLLEEAEKFAPDYSLFPNLNYSLTFASRGCINKCGFCVVPKVEGKLIHKPSWTKDIDLTKKRIIFMDNNWLALPKKDLLEDIKYLRDFIKQGISSIDFNQSIDARLFSKDIAEALKGLPIKPMRFSFDHMGSDKFCQNAIKLAIDNGFNLVVVDVLYNWYDTPENFYYRMKEVIKSGGAVMPMKYAPLDKPNRNYVGEKWTEKELKHFMHLKQYPHGMINPRTVEEFEYLFGKDEKEFKKLINFNGVKRLTQLKMNKLKEEMLEANLI